MAIEINYSETRGPNVDEFLSPQATQSCFLPICLYSFMINRPFLHEFLPWAVSCCLNPMIIIGDYLERHNVMVFDSLTEDEAIKKVEKRGQQVQGKIESLLINHKIDDRVKICSCREIIDTAECREIVSVIRNYASSHKTFNDDVDQQISLMIDNTKRISPHSVNDIKASQMIRLREYTIEEIAFFINLYNQGYTTEIYPGRDMKILQKMAASRYRDFPYTFSERTHISVAVLLDSGTSYARIDNNSN